MRGKTDTVEPGEILRGDLMVHPSTSTWAAVLESYPDHDPAAWIVELTGGQVFRLSRSQTVTVRRGWADE